MANTERKDYSLRNENIKWINALSKTVGEHMTELFECGYNQGFDDGMDEALKSTECKTCPHSRQTGEWKEERDEKYGISKFTCSQCGNVISNIEDRITFFTFNRFCGRCGSKNA